MVEVDHDTKMSAVMYEVMDVTRAPFGSFYIMHNGNIISPSLMMSEVDVYPQDELYATRPRDEDREVHHGRIYGKDDENPGFDFMTPTQTREEVASQARVWTRTTQDSEMEKKVEANSKMEGIDKSNSHAVIAKIKQNLQAPQINLCLP